MSDKIKERPIIFTGENVRAIIEGRKTQMRRIVGTEPKFGPCPYGEKGSYLWVRETFMFAKGADVRESYIGTDMEPMLGPKPWYAYRATEPDFGGRMFKWRPAIFMPRHASRLTLEITDVRVELLQDISEENALADGGWKYTNCPVHKNPQESFHLLWDSINGKRHPWESNPWVWVLGFRKLEGQAVR